MKDKLRFPKTILEIKAYLFLLPQLLSALRCCELLMYLLVHHLSLTCPVVQIKATNITSWSPDSVKYDIKSQ